MEYIDGWKIVQTLYEPQLLSGTLRLVHTQVR